MKIYLYSVTIQYTTKDGTFLEWEEASSVKYLLEQRIKDLERLYHSCKISKTTIICTILETNNGW